MTRSFTQIILVLGTVTVTAVNAFAEARNTTRSQSDEIAVSIAAKKQILVGQSPWVVLTVENLSDRDVVIHDYMWHIHVEGEKGEPRTTLVQRSITGKLRPGDIPPRADEYAIWSIFPGLSSDHKYKLTDFYDLSAPGKYSVYIEVMDPRSQKWLRTNIVNFEMQSPAH